MNLSHYIDLVRHLTGVEADVVACRTQIEEPSAEVEDAVSVSVRYTNGALGSLFATAALRGSEPSTQLRLWGPDGTIAVEPDPRLYTAARVERPTDESLADIWPPPRAEYPGDLLQQACHSYRPRRTTGNHR